MKNKKAIIIWCISIILIAVITMANMIINIFDISVPDGVIRVIGIMQLIILPVFPILVFVTGKRFMKKESDEEETR